MNVYIDNYISVKELAFMLKKKPVELIKDVFNKGIILKENDIFDYEKTKIICKDVYNIDILKKNNINIPIKTTKKRDNDIYVLITGNVNNGKTTFVDYILKKNIVKDEIGLITQNIYSYKFIFENKRIHIFDSPGHELFSDLIKNIIIFFDFIILIVSNDDFVNYKHINNIINIAKQSNIIVIICLNKFDKNNKINKNFLNYDIVFNISALTGYNIKNVINKIINIYKKVPKFLDHVNPGLGFVINSISKEEGIITTFFIYKGIIKIGYFLSFRNIEIKIDNLFVDDNSVDIVLSPNIFIIKNIIIPFEICFKIHELKTMYNNTLLNKYKDNYFNFENIYIKAFSHTIAYSIYNFYFNLKLNEKINIVRITIGELLDSEVKFCVDLKCTLIMIGYKIYNYKNSYSNILNYKKFNTIYELVNYFNETYKCNSIEKIVGELLIKDIFPIGKKNKIAGCVCIDGYVDVKNPIKIFKNMKLVFKGKIKSIKKNKLSVIKINKNEECGILIKNFNDFEINNLIKSYILI